MTAGERRTRYPRHLWAPVWGYWWLCRPKHWWCRRSRAAAARRARRFDMLHMGELDRMGLPRWLP